MKLDPLSLELLRLRWILSQPPINRKQARSLLCPLPYETLPSFVERREERHRAAAPTFRDLRGTYVMQW